MPKLIHGASAEAFHTQSRVVVTDMVPLPPDAGTSDVLLLTEMSHLFLEGSTTLVLID